jgi:hypothetical protein
MKIYDKLACLDCGEWDRTAPEGIGWTEHKLSLNDMLEAAFTEFVASYHREPDRVVCAGQSLILLMCLPQFSYGDYTPSLVRGIDIPHEDKPFGEIKIFDKYYPVTGRRGTPEAPMIYVGDEKMACVFDIVGCI